jgi:uncharacterized membrane protein YgdD (TMEM256/DUF423 family)
MGMSYRIWLFIAGLSGAFAVIVGAVIQHKAAPFDAAVVKSLETGQHYHMLHSLALLGVAALLAGTEGRRGPLGTTLLNLAGIAFVGGVLFFSFGIYTALKEGVVASARTIPFGGGLFISGWALLGLSALGLGRPGGKD